MGIRIVIGSPDIEPLTSVDSVCIAQMVDMQQIMHWQTITMCNAGNGVTSGYSVIDVVYVGKGNMVSMMSVVSMMRVVRLMHVMSLMCVVSMMCVVRQMYVMPLMSVVSMICRVFAMSIAIRMIAVMH